MEVGRGVVGRVGDGLDSFWHVWPEFQAGVENQRASGADKFGEMAECLKVSLFVAVDIEMVGVGRGDDGYGRGEVMERAVVLVGLDRAPVRTGREEEVAACVAQYAAEEGVASGVGLV